MEIKKVFSLLKKDLNKIEGMFKKYTVSEVALATRISNYILFSGGKRVRPAMFLLTAKMCGGDLKEVYPLACAVELLHTATLLHDDVIDEAKIRRGKKSARIVWDNKASILTGDFVNTQVFKILIKTRNFEILDLFIDATVDLINGEIFQLTKEKDTNITEADYFYIVKNKTAVLMAAAAAAGGLIAKKDKREVKALTAFGMNLGMAFQIIDDALDYAASEADLGKGLLADLGQGKITLPIIHILKEGTRADKATVKTVIQSEKQTKKDVKDIYNLIKKYDSINYVRGVAESYMEDAVKKLNRFPDSIEKEALLSISDFVISRSH